MSGWILVDDEIDLPKKLEEVAAPAQRAAAKKRSGDKLIRSSSWQGEMFIAAGFAPGLFTPAG